MTSNEAEPQHWSPPTVPVPAPRSAPPNQPTISLPPPNQPTINLAPPAPGELLRFGPGVPVPAATQDMSQATAVWRGEAQQDEGDGTRRPRRRRWLLTWLLPLLVLVAVLAILLWQRSGSPLAITNVAVHVTSPTLTCDGTEAVTAEMHTNGNSGTVTYRWRRSDGTVSDPLRQQVAKGSTDVRVVLLWSFHGQGTMNATATLEVLNPNSTSASATFAYACS